MITGIVIALPEEIGSLTAHQIRRGERIFIHDSLLVTCSGAGPLNAGFAAEQLIAHGAQRLISWGCAAALDPQLKPGDLVLATQLLADDGTAMAITHAWQQHTQQLLAQQVPLRTGTLLESVGIVTHAHAKQSLFAASQAVALDMESVAIARVAQQHALEFLAIRAIADPASLSLPLAVSHAMNAAGEMDIRKLLIYIVQHPSEIPALIKLGLHFNAAKYTLKTVARQLDAILACNEPSTLT